MFNSLFALCPLQELGQYRMVLGRAQKSLTMAWKHGKPLCQFQHGRHTPLLASANS